MDGTLLNDKKEVSLASREYLHHLQDSGIIVCLASGRPYRALRHYYDQIGLKSKMVCGNGNFIVDPMDNSKIIYESTYPRDEVLNIINEVGQDAFDLIFIEEDKKLFLNRPKRENEDFIWTDNMEVIVNHFDEVKTPTGVLFGIKDIKDKYRLIEAANKYSKNIGVRFWGTSLLSEMYFKDINKATGIRFLLSSYNLKMDDVICFGDDDNDLEMISQAGIGVGMINGSPLIKKYASMLSLDDNNNDGVIKTLKLLLHGI